MTLPLLLLLVQQAGAQPPAAAKPDSTAVRRATRDSTRSMHRDKAPRRQAVTPELDRSAFADPAARDLLLRARIARVRQDSALQSYDAKAYQRISVGLGVKRLARDRLLFRSESATHVTWSRNVGLWVEPLARRAAVPMLKEAKTEVDMLEMAPIPYFPGREALWMPSSDFGMVKAEVSEEDMVHPIATGAEAYYKYQTGDSVRIRLPDGHSITLRELRITARKPDWKLFVGSFWFDVETAQLVRAAYRMSVDMNVWDVAMDENNRERDLLKGDTSRAARDRRKALDEDDPPGWVRGMMSPMKATISSITVEYGLHEGRFWMPKVNSAEGFAQAGFMRMPVSFTESFKYASVNGSVFMPPLPPPPAWLRKRDSLAAARAGLDSLHEDSFGDDPASGSVSVRIGSSDRDRDSLRTAMRERARQATRDAQAGHGRDTVGDSVRGASGDTMTVAARDSVQNAIMAKRDSLRRVQREAAKAGDKKTAADAAAQLALLSTGEASRRSRMQSARKVQCDTAGSWVRSATRFNGQLRMGVRMPCDTMVLANSKELPGSLYGPDEQLFDEGAKDELLKSLDFSLQPEWAPQRPVLHYGLDLVRYNRVEGLSVGATVTQSLGKGYTAQALGRLGTGDWVPNVELSMARTNGRHTYQASVFQRLGVANDDWGTPLSLGASLASLIYARDEGFYYRTFGGELSAQLDARGLLTGRVFVERQRAAGDSGVVNRFSLGRAFSGSQFLPNIQAEDATEIGAASVLHRSFGADPSGARLVTTLRTEAATGTFSYARGAFDATVSRGLGAHFAAALTGSMGASGGTLPAQRLFYIGGSQTVRGQVADPTVAGGAGNAYWLGRAEIANGGVGFRPVLFYDVGWAGSRNNLSRIGRPLSGAGVGASFLDGLLRFDLSRGIYPRKGMRFDMYFDAKL